MGWNWWKVPQDEPQSAPPAYTEPTATKQSATECPVDPKTRSIWLQQAQAGKAAAPTPAPHPIPPGAEGESCPVDPKTREIWLQKAKSQKANLPSNHPEIRTNKREVQNQPKDSKLAQSMLSNEASEECSSDRISQSLSSPILSSTKTSSGRPLSQDREVSSIPRAQPYSTTSSSTSPSNSESETGQDKTTGNWIYPSESQFFNAVMRKSTTNTTPEALAQSIASIIPLHNAVNERAWHLIKAWEGNSSTKCGGPKLLSFQGLGAGAISPRAKMKSWMGYQEPFDRHDWVVERCDGETVEYVIDFYQGKTPEGMHPKDMGNLNLYLDVRPKLNSVQGCVMRFERLVGWR